MRQIISVIFISIYILFFLAFQGFLCLWRYFFSARIPVIMIYANFFLNYLFSENTNSWWSIYCLPQQLRVSPLCVCFQRTAKSTKVLHRPLGLSELVTHFLKSFIRLNLSMGLYHILSHTLFLISYKTVLICHISSYNVFKFSTPFLWLNIYV